MTGRHLPRTRSRTIYSREGRCDLYGQLGGVEPEIWRNFCESDTYEPGSSVQDFTVATGLEEGARKDTDSFECTGYLHVEIGTSNVRPGAGAATGG